MIAWFCLNFIMLKYQGNILQSRVLKNDFAKYNDDMDAEEDQEDNGWKIIHTDVFRFPKQKSLFCAVLGKLTQV